MMWFILVEFLGSSNDWMAFLASGRSLSHPALGTPWLQSERRDVEKQLSSDMLSALKYKAAQPEVLKGASATFNSIRSCVVRAVTGLSPKHKALWSVAQSAASPEHRIQLT